MENVMQQSDLYVRVPYAFFKRSMRTSARTMLAAVRSLETEERKAQISYRTFAKKLSLSTSTVARNVKALAESGEIKIDKSCRTAMQYTYTGKNVGKGYITVDAFLFGKEFTRRVYDKKAGKTYYVIHKLTDAEVYILALIDSFKAYTAGQAAIAKTLDYSDKTVARSIKALIGCSLIFRPKNGKSKKDRGELVANKKLLRELRGKLRKAPKSKKAINVNYIPQEVKDANARADAERAAFEKQESARRLEERLQAYLLKIPEYKAAHVEYKAKSLAHVKALRVHDDASVGELDGTLCALKATMDAIKSRVISTGEYLNSGQT